MVDTNKTQPEDEKLHPSKPVPNKGDYPLDESVNEPRDYDATDPRFGGMTYAQIQDELNKGSKKK